MNYLKLTVLISNDDIANTPEISEFHVWKYPREFLNLEVDINVGSRERSFKNAFLTFLSIGILSRIIVSISPVQKTTSGQRGVRKRIEKCLEVCFGHVKK